VEYNFELFIEKNMEKISRDTKDMFKKSKNTLLVEIATMKRKRGKNDGLTKIFEKSLSSLMKTLQKTEPFFVRCVNPNMEKSSKIFNRDVVEKQLRVGGLVEALRVLKEGYPTRVNYQEIYDLRIIIQTVKSQSRGQSTVNVFKILFGFLCVASCELTRRRECNATAKP